MQVKEKLKGDVQKLKSYWSDILERIRSDIAYIWTNEVMEDFEGIREEARKVESILKKIKKTMPPESYSKEISDIENLLSLLKKVKAREKWLKNVRDDLVQVIEDIENEIGIRLRKQTDHLKISSKKLRHLPRLPFDKKIFPFAKRTVFSPGTAAAGISVGGEYSNVKNIFGVTDFDVATFVDPEYSKPIKLRNDLIVLNNISKGNMVIKPNKTWLRIGEKIEVTFNCRGRKRKAIFIAGDATKRKYIPKNFNIFYSGDEIVVGKFYGTKSSPESLVKEIVARLPEGGFFYEGMDNSYLSVNNHLGMVRIYESSDDEGDIYQKRRAVVKAAKQTKAA